MNCNYEEHFEKEPIIGFCINPECRDNPKVCHLCITKFHRNHQQQCKCFTELESLIKDLKKNIDKQIKNLQETYEGLKTCTEQILKKMGQDVGKLDKLLQSLQQKEFKNYKEEIQIIYEVQSTENDDNLSLIIHLLKNSLGELKSFMNAKNEQISKKSQVNLNKSEIKVQSGELKQQKIEKNNQAESKCQLDEGILLFNHKNYFEALKKFEDGIKIEQGNDVLYYWKSSSLYNLHRYQDAIEFADKAINLNSKNENAFIIKSQALFEQARYQEAVEQCDIIINLNPRNAGAQLIKKNILHKIEQCQEKLEQCNKIISQNKSPLVMKQKADILVSLGKKKEAKQWYENALKEGYAEKSQIYKQFTML